MYKRKTLCRSEHSFVIEIIIRRASKGPSIFLLKSYRLIQEVGRSLSPRKDRFNGQRIKGASLISFVAYIVNS